MARYEADDVLQRVIQSWLIFYEDNQSDLGHYFQHLYRIIKSVDRSDVDQPRYYTNLVRAQLSSYAPLLLFRQRVVVGKLLEVHRRLPDANWDALLVAGCSALSGDDSVALQLG